MRRVFPSSPGFFASSADNFRAFVVPVTYFRRNFGYTIAGIISGVVFEFFFFFFSIQMYFEMYFRKGFASAAAVFDWYSDVGKNINLAREAMLCFIRRRASGFIIDACTYRERPSSGANFSTRLLEIAPPPFTPRRSVPFRQLGQF